MNHSEAILESWEVNAQNWIATINDGDIESRLVTNEAVVDAVVRQAPKTVLDAGCGEGWLSRTLRKQGLTVYGIDAVKELVEAATEKDGPWYFHYSYKQLTVDNHQLPAPFDVIVINFALIDKEDSEAIIKYVPHLLPDSGRLIIQTLHPWTAASGTNYQTGWQEGSWAGMKKTFVQPYQWWFRTLENWTQLFKEANLDVEEIVEPILPNTLQPASIIFVCKTKSNTLL